MHAVATQEPSSGESPDREAADPTVSASASAPGVETAATGPLTGRERDVLAFAQLTWRYAGAHESAISERFGWTTTRYFQILNALLDRPEALEHDPMLINRLRRLRDERLRARSPRQEPGVRRATE